MRWSTEVKVGKEAFSEKSFWVKENGVTQVVCISCLHGCFFIAGGKLSYES